MQMEHFLSESSERARRNLMLFSSFCIFLALLGELPTNVPVLGIDLDTSHKQALVAWSFLVVQIYFLFRFSVLAWVDLLNWAVTQDAKARGGYRNLSDYRMQDLLKTVRERLRGNRSATVANLARFLEQILPIGYGVIALFANILIISVQNT